MTKGNHLLISSKYHSVKSLNVYIFRVSGSTLLALWASCQGDLLSLHKNSLALGKWTGVLSCPALSSLMTAERKLPINLSVFIFNLNSEVSSQFNWRIFCMCPIWQLFLKNTKLNFALSQLPNSNNS